MYTIRDAAGTEIATVAIAVVNSATIAGAVLTALAAADGVTLEVSTSGVVWHVRSGEALYTVEPL